MRNLQGQKTEGAENLSNSFRSSLVQLGYGLEKNIPIKVVITLAQLSQKSIFNFVIKKKS